MATQDPRVDAYIAKSAAFAQPILIHLREVIHEACPQAQETIKWGMPFFEFHGPLCHFAAFKQHCAFGFWKARGVIDTADCNTEAMGQFGRVTSLDELPTKRVLLGYVRAAMKLKALDSKTLAPKKAPKPPPSIPSDLRVALTRNKKALATFDAFSASCKREYVEWLTQAKREETRAKRLAQTIEWLAQGKQRNWKYANC